MNNITTEGKRSEQRAEEVQKKHREVSETLTETRQAMEQKETELTETSSQLSRLRRKTARLIGMLNDVSISGGLWSAIITIATGLKSYHVVYSCTLLSSVPPWLKLFPSIFSQNADENQIPDDSVEETLDNFITILENEGNQSA